MSKIILNPVGLVRKGERTGQEISGILANPMNQVLRRIENPASKAAAGTLDGRALQVCPVRKLIKAL